MVQFWREAGPSKWFAKDPAFDKTFRERFASQYEAAASGKLKAWRETPEGALALIILLDQYPRNSFRDTPKMYATDAKARDEADRAVRAGHDMKITDQVAMFFYLPFGHSESLRDQERSVKLAQRFGADGVEHATHHRDIVKRFGRFPHRNPILGRTMRPEEQRYLDNGGYQG